MGHSSHTRTAHAGEEDNGRRVRYPPKVVEHGAGGHGRAGRRQLHRLGVGGLPGTAHQVIRSRLVSTKVRGGLVKG